MPQEGKKKHPEAPPIPPEDDKERPTSQHQQKTASTGMVVERGTIVSSGERIKEIRPTLKKSGDPSGGQSGVGSAKNGG